MPENRIGIADYLAALRTELRRARADRASDMSLSIDSIEIELAVTVTRNGEANAGIHFWVFEAGASGSKSREDVQRLVLKLSAKDANDGDFEISDRERRPEDTADPARLE